MELGILLRLYKYINVEMLLNISMQENIFFILSLATRKTKRLPIYALFISRITLRIKANLELLGFSKELLFVSAAVEFDAVGRSVVDDDCVESNQPDQTKPI